MSKLSLEEILEIPELAFYIEPEEFLFFTNKNKDFEVMANLYNAEKIDTLINRSSQELNGTNIADFFYSETGDSIVTKGYGEVMKNILLKYSKFVNKDALLLLLGGLASKYLRDIENSKKLTEIVYSDGTIINVGPDTQTKKDSIEGKHDLRLNDLRGSLIEGILIASKELQDVSKRNKNFAIRGIYAGRGLKARKERLEFSLQDLDNIRKDKLIFRYLDANKIKEFFKKKLLTYSDILKAMSNNNISRVDAILLFRNGVVKKEDLLKKLFKVSDFDTVMRRKEEDLETKLLLYTIGESNIKTLEKNASNSKNRENGVDSEFFRKIAGFYNHKKIGELLTHNVLTYIESKHFLEILVEQKVIDNEEKSYFEKVMEDFKCNEFLNKVQSEVLEKGEESKPSKPIHMAGLTIDPKLRLEYLKSIGAVKRVRINGEMSISEDSKERKKTNSLDGYELLIIPDKKIAILEKFYQVTRDKEGHMRYKTNENGEYIPAVENATYILPIGIAKDLVESKNKKNLISSPYVYRTFHTMDWVSSTEIKMHKINPEIEFQKENTDNWRKRISDNYKRNKENRTIDF